MGVKNGSKDRSIMTNKNQLAPFVTNLDGDVFCLTNLPEVVKGALFSRYSRSEKDLKTILLEEFLDNPEINLQALVNHDLDRVNTAQAEAFYDRVLLGYGDDSVAELGGAHIACENISNIAAKALEDARIGISPLEKSTRYVRFDQQRDGKYSYYREPAIMASQYAGLYEETMDDLFDTYSVLVEPLSTRLKTRIPKGEATTGRAYNTAIKAKALDILRGLLPMATQTNVGLYGNGRAFEHLLIKLAASPHAEVRELGQSMQEELMKVIPSFVKRASMERGQRQSERIAARNEAIARMEANMCSSIDREEDRWGESINNGVLLVDSELPDIAEMKVLSEILYGSSNCHLGLLYTFTYSHPSLAGGGRADVIRDYLGDRETRFDKVGRAFESVYYTFDILADIGAYRDLQRHRMLSQSHQAYTVQHGYDIPRELVDAGLGAFYCEALDKVFVAFEQISKDFPEAAQYMVPMAYKVRWKITMNLKEAYHFIELRSGRQGHSSYRKIAQEMYLAIKSVHPLLAEGMLVDMNDYDLERLAAEQKNDKKAGNT